MPEPANGGYQVLCSLAVAETLKELQRRATRRGQGKAFLTALKQIIKMLGKNPNTVGEALYRLPNLRLRVRTVIVSPLAIDFAVSDENFVVYLKSGTLLSASRR
jgi:hypothetical protein